MTAAAYSWANRHWLGLLAVAVLLLSVAVYAGRLDAPLGSDARFLSYQNTLVRDPGGFLRVWTADFFGGADTPGGEYRSGYYRPITNLTFWVEFRLAGRRDWVYHLVEILLHGLNAFLVALVTWRIGRSRPAAVLAGFLFVTHPIHAFAATNPAARADVLFTALYLMAFLAFDRVGRNDRGARAWMVILASTLLYLMAILSKEMAVTLPAVLVLLLLLRHFRDGWPLTTLVRTLPAWGAFAGYLVWRFGILGMSAPTVGYAELHSRVVLAVGAIRGMVIHLSRLVLPLSPSYPELNPWLINSIDGVWSDPFTYIALVVVTGLTVGVFLWRRAPLLAFWLGFFLVSFSPLMSVDSIAGTMAHDVLLTQERWAYLPAVAVLALAAHGAAELLLRSAGRARAGMMTAFGVVLLGLGISAGLHAGKHADPLARLRQLYLFPEDRLSRMEQANKLMLHARWVAAPAGDLEDAEARAREALRIMPDSPIPAAALGDVLNAREKWDETVRLLLPWLDPPPPILARYQATNFRIMDDVNRVGQRIPLILGRAFAGTGDLRRALIVLCVAARRGQDPAIVRAAIGEANRLASIVADSLPPGAPLAPRTPGESAPRRSGQSTCQEPGG